MRAISAAAKLDKAVMDVNRQVSAASTAPLERDECLRVQVSGLTSGAFPLASFLNRQFQKENPKWCAPIIAAKMLDKAIMDVNRQVSARRGRHDEKAFRRWRERGAEVGRGFVKVGFAEACFAAMHLSK